MKKLIIILMLVSSEAMADCVKLIEGDAPQADRLRHYRCYMAFGDVCYYSPVSGGYSVSCTHDQKLSDSIGK
jgi:hypothetical protein